MLRSHAPAHALRSSNNIIGVHASHQGCGSECEFIPEEFLMHGVNAYSLLFSLHLLMSQEGQGFYRGWAGEGAPPPGNIVPVWNHLGTRPTGLVQGRKEV